MHHCLPRRQCWLRFLLLPMVCGAVESAEGWRPNVIVLLADDLGYGELGCYGGSEIPTPHLDALAKAGVRFTAGYVTAPFCAASRAGFLTGRYQTRFGFEFNPIGPQNDDPKIGLPRSERTLAEDLRDSGYATALIGKWHLGGTAAYHPQRRGFDEFFGFLHEGHGYVPAPWRGVTTWLRRRSLPDGGAGRWTAPDGRVIWSTHLGQNEPDYDANNPILRSSQPVTETEYLTTAFTREAVDFVRRHQTQPFLVCVAYNAVHSPMQATDADLARFPQMADSQRRIFAALLASLDDSVGKLVAAVDECGLANHTLILFFSDNGGPTRELTSSNRPLRGEKGSLYEGGIRVPMLLRWPAQVPAGNEESRPVISLDLAATIRSAARFKLPHDTDGVDLVPHLKSLERPAIHDQLYWRVGSKAALRQGRWKLVRTSGKADANWELYDLSADMSERTNLAASEIGHVDRLRQAWEQIDSQMAAPLW